MSDPVYSVCCALSRVDRTNASRMHVCMQFDSDKRDKIDITSETSALPASCGIKDALTQGKGHMLLALSLELL